VTLCLLKVQFYEKPINAECYTQMHKKEGKRHDCPGLFGQAFLYALIDRKTRKERK